MKCDEIFAALAMLEKERGISQTFMMDKIVQALTTENVARLDGVGLVQNITQRAGDGLAVEDVHAAVLINVDPQIPLSGLADIFHVPELAAVLFDHGERQFAHGLCHFLHCIPRNPCFFRNLQKKERAKRSTLRFLHP